MSHYLCNDGYCYGGYRNPVYFKSFFISLSKSDSNNLS